MILVVIAMVMAIDSGCFPLPETKPDSSKPYTQ